MPIILAGNDAFDKWRHGKDAWNAWVEENPVADVSFADVDFSRFGIGSGIISFSGFKFPNGLVDFSGARFGKGLVSFSGARFGKGYVDFARADFGDGDVDFLGASFGEGEVKFEDITFHGKANFSRLKNCEAVKRFSFRNVSFEKAFMISGKFECVVDMVGTKTGHHVDLSGLTCYLQREWSRGFRKAKKPEGADRLRRLKELAENNKHHEAALRFHADEMRAKRWHKTGRLASILDMLFSATSNYGQSILRPFVGLVILMIFMSCLTEKDAVTIIRDILFFLPASRTEESSIISILRQFFAFIFIFLIGLGLRNRFRI